MPALALTFGRTALVIAATLLLLPTNGASQATVRVRATENFRREPNGDVLASLSAGTPLTVVEHGPSWTQVDLEGWVWIRSLQATRRAGFDLIVSEADGENLRDGPSGDVLGHLERGTLLEELEREPGWIRVRRRGWIWTASTVQMATAPGETAAPSVEVAVPPARVPGAFVRVDGRSAAILTAPDGDTLVVTAPGTEVEMLAREGSWARVRVEGWLWLPEVGADAAREGDAETALTPADLSGQPDRYRGRVVSWRLQFISLERAETVRTDFFEGEPFLLTRFGGSEGPFVYVAVPPERVAELGDLVPLEHVTVTGRIRAGASTLTGTPIIDLLGLERR